MNSVHIDPQIHAIQQRMMCICIYIFVGLQLYSKFLHLLRELRFLIVWTYMRINCILRERINRYVLHTSIQLLREGHYFIQLLRCTYDYIYKCTMHIVKYYCFNAFHTHTFKVFMKVISSIGYICYARYCKVWKVLHITYCMQFLWYIMQNGLMKILIPLFIVVKHSLLNSQ